MQEKKYRAIYGGRNSKCVDCGKPWFKGDWIVRVAVAKFRHLECPKG